MSDIDRKLVTVEQIKEILPHTNADKLEIARVRGWNVVVGKGEFKPNNLVVFFEIDSFLPIEPRYEFLRKNCYRSNAYMGEGFKIKTIKLRGEVSQGLILPLSEFPEFGYSDMSEVIQYRYCLDKEGNYVIITEGTDLTDILNVRKWELPIGGGGACLKGNALGLFPSFIPKTDEERIQNIPQRILDIYKNDAFEVSIKMDGTSFTAYRKDDHIGVCSRNLEIKDEDDNIYWKVAREHGILAALEELGLNIAFQGELCGPGILRNRAKLTDHDIFIFNIYDIDERRYYNSYQRYTLIDDKLNKSGKNISHIKVEEFLNDFPNVEGLSKYCNKIKFNGQKIEGVVFKSCDNPSFSFKFINPSYLLENDE